MQKDKQQELDAMLSEDCLQVPDGFAQRVMQEIQASQQLDKPSFVSQGLQWFALAGGFLLGAQQLLNFVFGVWLATIAAG